jgi:hypothetical protein
MQKGFYYIGMDKFYTNVAIYFLVACHVRAQGLDGGGELRACKKKVLTAVYTSALTQKKSLLQLYAARMTPGH